MGLSFIDRKEGREVNPAKNALKLFSDMNAENIRYCHWKSNEHLLPGLTGKTDLDILIDPSDADRAVRLMLENNFKQVISHPWKRYSAVDDWIGLDEEQMLQTHLHVHYRLLTGLKNVKDQYFKFNELVLANTVKHDEYDIMICNPNIEIIFLIIRAALKRSSSKTGRKIFDKGAKAELEYLKARADINEVDRFAHEMFEDALAREVIGVFESPENYALFKRMRSDLIKSQRFMQRTTRAGAECTYLRRDIRYKAGKLIKKPVRLKKCSATGGKLISFIGVDGAGKTTLATFYAKWLSWKIDCRYVYLGTGDGKSSLLNRIKKKLLKLRKSSSSASSSSSSSVEKKLTGKQALKRTINNIVNYSNDKYKYKTIRKIYRSINRGQIVITDRFPQPFYPGIYDGMIVEPFAGNGFLAKYNRKLKMKEQKLFDEMCRFNPDIIIKLDIPVEVSDARKPCTPKELEIVKRKVEITKTLHYKGAKEFIVDSSKDLEQTKREVISLLWRHI